MKRPPRPCAPHAILLTWAHVCERLDMSPTTAYDVRKQDPDFPKAVDVPGAKRRWFASEVAAYAERLKARRDAAAGSAA